MNSNPHNKQKFSQIFLPLTLAILVVFFCGYLLFRGISDDAFQIRLWGNISAIFVILPLLVLLVFDLFFIIFWIYLLRITRLWIASKLPLINQKVAKFTQSITRAAGAAIHPVIMAESALASLKRGKK